MSVDKSGGNPNMDYQQHENTYKFFITLVKFGSAAVIGVLVLMYIFLV